MRYFSVPSCHDSASDVDGEKSDGEQTMEEIAALKEEIIASLKRENQILKEEVVGSLKRENALLKASNQMLREQMENLKASSEAVIKGLPEVLQAANALRAASP